MNRTEKLTVAAAVAAALGACSSMPERVATLDQARTAVESLQGEPLADEVAEKQLTDAQQSLARAERAYEERGSRELVEHNAYLALRNAQIAQQMIAEERAREEISRGETERTRVQLEAREREAERARQQAAQASALAEERAIEAERRSEDAAQARQLAGELQRELADLEAQQTERGLVLTLDDVLFDVNRATLKSGADSTMARLASFLNEHPERRILIEGHTDATGTDEHNRQLSEERADAVRDELMERGIAPERVITRGLGEAYPLASNDTSAGRQLNRRVEIVISDPAGGFPATAERVG